ncbi:hypothetical protein RRG08_022194 [Elysia crispata]|uniref:Uncharacterized protein n=1 Tax=Elysia crispata TaxID=231223 RepID=A0AAE1D6S6_9GAST|nr:hypothetical protein RRG08_022194 [Elysia crispata]
MSETAGKQEDEEEEEQMRSGQRRVLPSSRNSQVQIAGSKYPSFSSSLSHPLTLPHVHFFHGQARGGDLGVFIRILSMLKQWSQCMVLPDGVTVWTTGPAVNPSIKPSLKSVSHAQFEMIVWYTCKPAGWLLGRQ